MTDTNSNITSTLRPFSTSSVISPHAALEALTGDMQSNLSIDDGGDGETTLSTSTASSSRHPITTQAESEFPYHAHSLAETDTIPEPQPQTQGEPSPNSPQYIVRAQFDFDASDPSALSFKSGDVIEVYTMLESGWWDGMLDGRRGWFPSNFVEELHVDEEDGDGDGDTGQSSSELNQGHEHSHGPGLVGDQMDRDRDMALLDQEEFGVPSRHKRDISGSQTSTLEMDEGWGSGAGLDDLAREMMDSSIQDTREEDEGKAFQAEAMRRRRLRDSDDVDDFGTLKTPYTRRREETDDTIRQHRNGPGTGGGTAGPLRTTGKARESVMQDAWIPSLTPEGQVYYVNTHTGETSWEIPMTTPSGETEGEENDFYFQGNGTNNHNRQSNGNGSYYQTYSAPSSSNHLDRDAGNTEESFRLPPYTQGEIPYPWFSKMSDDGTGYVYYNRITGQTRSNIPSTGGQEFGGYGGTRRHGSYESGHTPIENQRKSVQDWEKRTRLALANLLQANQPPTLASMIDNVNDSLREIFEATVAGAAAEEEMSRAHDMGSESGMATAAMREEGAREALSEAHNTTLGLLRELLMAFGYVGPLDKMDEMPRPGWATDVTLIGSIGLLSSHVHAAVTSRIGASVDNDSDHTIWGEVMRTAARLRDVVGDLPHRMAVRDITQGKQLIAWLGIDSFDMLGGRWGFSTIPTEHEMRELNQGFVLEIQRIKGESEAVIRSGDILNIIRVASKLHHILSTVDIAISIDIDGELSKGGITGSRARAEDLELYNDLIQRARQQLHDLDTAYTSLTTHCVNLLSNPNTIPLTVGIERCFTAISTLLMVSREQHALLSQSQIAGSIGHRSANRTRLRQRPGSMASQASIVSRTSRASKLSDLEEMRRKAKSMEQEFEEEERSQDHARQMERERAFASASASASQSHTSLRQSTSGHGQSRYGHGKKPSASATSSSTSLVFKDTESESGSQKGNRSSFMRFMKGRSSEDDGGSRRNKPSKKLAKLLGEDSFAQLPLNQLPPHAQTVPAPHVHVPLPPLVTPIPERAWYLGEDYDPSEIVFDDKGAVKAGTLKALVARLTPHGSTDTAFFQAFLLTFRSFTSGDDLMDLLLERYNIQPPHGLNAGEMMDWTKQKQTPIRLRVVNTLRNWLDVHYLEDQDASMLDRVNQFTQALHAEGSVTMATQLSNLVTRRRTTGGDGPRRTVSGGLLSPPAPLIPRVPSGRGVRLLDISPVELARQFTIIESLHFQRIKAIECLNKAWAKEEGPKSAPNVRWVILTANRMAGWVALQILSSKDVKVRASTMKYFVQTAIELKTLNNFSSMAGVVAGLNSAPITRLKRTKELLSAKTVSLKANLDATLDSSKNFANYKDMLKTINPPCVPFFGFYLSALTFIEDGNKDLVQPEGHTQPLINFFKRSLSADILRDIQQYQSQPYNLARCKPVYDYITNGLEVVEGSGDLYEMSLVLEPREREEERVTRMLHDSGFL